MLDERDEFLISRWVDGDLTAEERARVEKLLAESDAARAMLREYRQISGLLRLSRETPDIDFGALRSSIHDAIDRVESRPDLVRPPEPAEDIPPPSLRLPKAATRSRSYWARWSELSRRQWVAMAASVVLALGLSWQLYRTAATHAPVGPAPGDAATPPSRLVATVGGPGTSSASAPGILNVRGPSTPRPAGTITLDVRVGPPPALAREYPNIRHELRELYPGYGRIELRPDATPASTRQRPTDSRPLPF